jgi:general secretion pathway protein M
MNGAKNVYNQVREQFTLAWQGRTEQERRFLTIGGGIAAAVILWATLIDPAVTGRKTLARQLPEMRQQAAELQAMAVEASKLQAQPAVQAARISREGLATSLSARGIKPESIIVTGEFVKLDVKDVVFANLLAWLDEQRRASRLTVQDLNLTGQEAKPGVVDGKLTLRQTGLEGR